MITESIIQLLVQNQQLALRVGDRIEPNVIKPDSFFPAVYVSSYRMQKMPCDNGNGVMTGTIEIGVYSTSYAEAAEIMYLIRTTLDDFSGFINGVGISILNGEQTADDYDEEGARNIQVIEYEAFAQISST
ncbi:hypothetical protein LZG74_16870 [Dyadobacter sp. CY327]|uniref:tail completion protein gp17 n=1 Tax=Dyadobacter sp. CY327 TaxID=2907301 RepID=UPI001F2DBDB1|nr:hypothetical protein [Dyadobacter sp. CY327]MCE7071991.1 hypothetical protein [Dyadobacter sp. CY327]